MAEPSIVVRNLSKTYRVPEREAGLAASLKSLALRAYRDVEAVREISFTVDPGEMVGFIGPNGAGKTTTLKMLSGLLYPTSGEARVLGSTPWERKADYLRRISMVLGNRSQMLWDIPPLDTFRVLGEIYRVPPDELDRTLDELADWSPGLFTWIFDSLFQMARYPVGLYPDWLRLVLTWIVPVGMVTTVPAQALAGNLPVGILAGAVVLAAVLLLGASALFRIGLRRYASASS